MIEDKNINIHRSRLDSKFTVGIIYRGHEDYKIVKQQFNKYGLAAMDTEHRIIFIDGEAIKGLTQGHLYFIEAHEIVHYKLNHTNPMTKEKEMEADFGACLLCKHKQLIDAYNIGISQFYLRNNVMYGTYNKLYGKNIRKKLNFAENMI